jgi:L-methionine (R)-S-oxide reductase
MYMNIRNQQIKSFLQEDDLIACLSNLSAFLKLTYEGSSWTGFYFVKNKEFVLGPFQGLPACTHISISKGILGRAYRSRSSQRIADVTTCTDHVTCDPASRSELVTPIIVGSDIPLLIDLDAPVTNFFTKDMEAEMEQAARDLAAAWEIHHWSL